MKKIVCSDNIYLREITEADTQMVIGWRNSPIVRPYFIYQAEITEEDHLAWLKNKVATGKVVQYIIVVDEKPVGSVYLQDIDYKHCKAEYGIFIGETSALEKGVGSLVARCFVQFAFTELKLHRVYLRVYEDNIRAIKSYENAGFKKEALLRDDVFVNDVFRNIVIMGTLNETL